MPRTRPYRDLLLESLADPETAAAYLTEAISDSPEMFRKALRNVAQSRQMAKVAREAGVERESLYLATSERGNPTLHTLNAILGAVGVKIELKPNVAEAASSAPPAPQATTVGTSGYRNRIAGTYEDAIPRQLSGSVLGTPTFMLASGQTIANASAFEFNQGNEGLWLQKTLQHHKPLPTSEGRMTLPPATQTMYSWSQLSGT